MKKLGNVLIEVMQDLSRVSTNGEATVKVNRTMCSPERFEQLFNYFSKGTILERINLNVQPMDSKLECGCGYAEVIDEDHNGYDRCPQCGRFADIKDTDYQLVDPHPEKAMERKSIRF